MRRIIVIQYYADLLAILESSIVTDKNISVHETIPIYMEKLESYHNMLY